MMVAPNPTCAPLPVPTMRSAHLLLPLFLLAACSSEDPAPKSELDTRPSPIQFADGTAAAGIDFLHVNGKSDEKFYIEQMGSGAIFFDADGDGDPDLFLLNGKKLRPEPGDPISLNAFYINDGKGHFTDASLASGLADGRYAVGVAGADFDNDGDIDIHVSNFDAPNAFYRNEGDGTFVDIAEEAGLLGGPGLLSSCAFADVDGDGWVDLYVGYCHDHTIENNKVCMTPLRDGSGDARRYCSPAVYNPVNDILYKNMGDGTFKDISEESGISSGIGRTLGVAFADFDDDGDQDLMVACDRTRNLYYTNDGKGHFSEHGVMTGAAVSDTGKVQAGMGITTGDFDGDAKIDIAVTYFKNERNAFYSNKGNNVFRDVSAGNGTAKSAYPLLAWGVAIFDADLDTDADALIVNGRILPHLELFNEPIAGYEQPNLLYENLGAGKFRCVNGKAGAGIDIEKVSRGLAMADVDMDGDLDALVANIHEVPDLLINESPREGRHWLMLHLTGTVSNRSAIGARATAYLADKKLVREVFTGQSYLSQNELRVHFGLGQAAVLPKLEVRWPSGIVTTLENVKVDQVLELTEPAE